METITHNYKGFTIDIINDEHYDETPNTWNEDYFLVYDHGQFDVRVEGFKPKEIFNHLEAKQALTDENLSNEDREYWERQFEYYDNYSKNYHIFPVNAYIHSGVALSLSNNSYPFNDRWDVSTSGYFLVKKEVEPDVIKAFKNASGTIETWNDLLMGNVWGFNVTNQFDEEIHSCWGFIGDHDGDVLEEAKGVVDSEIKRHPIKYAKQLTLDL